MEQYQGFNNFSMEQVMAFAASPTGKQLIGMLQNMGSADFDKAQSYAAAGDLEGAKKELSALLSDPKIMALLKQFGG